MNKHTAELLEKHFDTAFAAPNGIKKLRELILTLAMQGRLVPQDPNDQPASELLLEIEAEKQQLVNKGKIKKPKPLPLVMEEETPYALPQGWAWVRLGAVVLAITGGGTPSKNNPAFWEGEIPWASVKDLNVETYLDSTIDSITEAAVATSSTNVIPKGQIIVCTRMGLGKIAINRIDTAINQDLKALSISTHIDRMYFFNKYKNYNIIGSGMTVQGIRQDDLLNFLFPLPPLEEQHRIVAKIDELMARCDELEKLRTTQQGARLTVHTAAIKQLLNIAEPGQHQRAQAFLAEHFGELYTVKENVAELRKAILQLAVMGKLVPQDPNDQPASELLKEIEAEKQRLVKEGKIKKPKPLPTVMEEEKPYALPQGWEWVRLGNILDFEYGDNLPERKRTNSGEFPVYGSNGIVGTHNKAFVNTQCIVIGRKGSAGALNLCLADGCCVTDVAYYCIPPKEINLTFCFRLLHTLRLDSLGKGIKPGLNRNEAYLLVIAVPPRKEQHRIVAKIDELMALCDSLEQQIDANTNKQAELLSALIHMQSQGNIKNAPQPAALSKAQVIDLTTYRAAIGCYAIKKLANAQYFGRTAAAKVMYLAQAHVGLELGLKPEREAAGPLDTWIYDFEQQGQSKRWFEVQEKTLAGEKKKKEYRCLPALSESAAQAEDMMSSDQKAEFDRLIYALVDKTTEQVEIIATLFAVWNDFLIDGVQPTDEKIIKDLRQNWHDRKARFSPSDLQPWLSWLRQEKFVPRGLSPRTVQQSKLDLD